MAFQALDAIYSRSHTGCKSIGRDSCMHTECTLTQDVCIVILIVALTFLVPFLGLCLSVYAVLQATLTTPIGEGVLIMQKIIIRTALYGLLPVVVFSLLHIVIYKSRDILLEKKRAEHHIEKMIQLTDRLKTFHDLCDVERNKLVFDIHWRAKKLIASSKMKTSLRRARRSARRNEADPEKGHEYETGSVDNMIEWSIATRLQAYKEYLEHLSAGTATGNSPGACADALKYLLSEGDCLSTQIIQYWDRCCEEGVISFDYEAYLGPLNQHRKKCLEVFANEVRNLEPGTKVKIGYVLDLVTAYKYIECELLYDNNHTSKEVEAFFQHIITLDREVRMAMEFHRETEKRNDLEDEKFRTNICRLRVCLFCDCIRNDIQNEKAKEELEKRKEEHYKRKKEHYKRKEEHDKRKEEAKRV